MSTCFGRSNARSDTINVVYHDKPLILQGLRFGRSSFPIIRQWIWIAEYVRVYQCCFCQCIRHDKWHDKSFIFNGATFREKLVSHHQAVSEADPCLLTMSVRSKPTLSVGKWVHPSYNLDKRIESCPQIRRSTHRTLGVWYRVNLMWRHLIMQNNQRNSATISQRI